MITDDLENELRSAFAKTADSIVVPRQARQRLLQRDYHPKTGNRRLAAGLAAATIAAAAIAATAAGVALRPLSGRGGPRPPRWR